MSLWKPSVTMLVTKSWSAVQIFFWHLILYALHASLFSAMLDCLALLYILSLRFELYFRSCDIHGRCCRLEVIVKRDMFVNDSTDMFLDFGPVVFCGLVHGCWYKAFYKISAFKAVPLQLRDPHNQDWWHTFASWGISKIPCVVIGLEPLLQKYICALKTRCKGTLDLILVVAHLKWGGDRDPLLIFHWTIAYSKLDYGCIMYDIASNANLQQLDSIHNAGLRFELGALYTSPVSSMYMDAKRSSFEGTSAKTVHALLSENSGLHWQPSILCVRWIWPNHKGGVHELTALYRGV